jgi:hypothetical protein
MSAEKETSRKALTISKAELTLLRERTFAPPRLVGTAISSGNSMKLYLTVDDAEELLGFVAAAANHESAKRRAKALDSLFEKVHAFEASFTK